MKIFAPSWKRADIACTHKYLTEVVYVVAESQKTDYNGLKILVCPDSAQGNLCRVRNWILNNQKGDILLIDDDLTALGVWIGNQSKKLNEAEAIEFIEHGFILAKDMGCKYWGINPAMDKGSYREYTPFSTKTYIGGPFQAFIDLDLRYDENLPLKEDYDLTIQVLNKNRKALRINYAHYFNDMHGKKGGCADYRTIEKEKEQFKLLQKKWGSKIVRTDSGESQVNRKKKKTYDINPIIKVPINGV
jgi:hypothetical protein